MNISAPHIERLPHSRIRLSFKIESAEVERYWRTTLDHWRTTAVVKGFRKGKAPDTLLLQHWGERIRHEALRIIVGDALKEILKTIEEQPLASDRPRLENSPHLDPAQELPVVIEYDTYPEAEIGPYRDCTIRIPPPPEMTTLNQELRRLREQHATLVPRSASGVVRSGDSVTIDFQRLGDNNEIVEKRSAFSFVIGSSEPPPFASQLIGMHRGQQYTEEKLTVQIKEIQERQLPKLDDQFASTINADLKSLTALKEYVKAQLAKKQQQALHQSKCLRLLAHIAEHSKFEIPRSMMQHELGIMWRQFLYHHHLSVEEGEQFLQREERQLSQLFKEWQPQAERRIVHQIILQAISEREQIALSDEEFEEQFQQQSLHSPQNKQNNTNAAARALLQEQKLFRWLVDHNRFIVDKRLESDILKGR